MHRIEAYIRLAILFILVLCLCYIPVFFILKKKGVSTIRQIAYLGTICSMFFILCATILFVPINFHPEKHILNLNPLDWLGKESGMQQFIVEKIPNILLFIPLGFMIPVVYKSKRTVSKVLLVSFIITFSVEFVQYFIGRSSDIVDVLTNLFGALIGYGLFALSNKLFQSCTWWNQLLAIRNE